MGSFDAIEKRGDRRLRAVDDEPTRMRLDAHAEEVSATLHDDIVCSRVGLTTCRRVPNDITAVVSNEIAISCPILLRPSEASQCVHS